MALPSPSERLPVPWHRRLEVRILVCVSLLVGLSLWAVMLITTRVVTARSFERATSDIEGARSAFYGLVDNRADFAEAQSRLITSSAAFRAQLTALDVSTMEETADIYRQQLDAQFFLVTDGAGKRIGRPGWPQDLAPPAALGTGIDNALAGRPQRDIIALQGRLFLIVSQAAIFEGKALGTMTAGYALDDVVAKELAAVTCCEITLVSAGQLSASNLPQRDQADLSALLASSGLGRGSGVSPEVSVIGGRAFVHGVFSLFPDRPSESLGQMVLSEEWGPTQQLLDELRSKVLLAGAATFALALFGALVFSNRMQRLLGSIARTAQDIAGDNLFPVIPVRGGAEAATLAVAFNEMTANLRRSQEEAREKSKRLETSHQRFLSITESVRDAIVATDDQGAITFWNASAQTILGYEEHEVLGQLLTEFIADQDRPAYRGALPLAGHTSDGLTPGGVVELTALRKDGSRFPAEVSLARWRAGEATSITAVIRDVTERRNTQEALRQRENQLVQAQKMEAIGQLAGGVAHDLNNMLMAIHGYAELLIDGIQPDDVRRGDAEEILKASDRASSLTQQLLAFNPRPVTAPAVVALDEVFASTEKMLRRLVGEDINLITSVQANLGHVRADTGQMEQVLMNLVLNARDAMTGGGTLRIEMKNIELDEAGTAAHHELKPGAYVELTVADTGTVTTKGGSGPGLGLATVYGIVQQCGGVIDTFTEPGYGTRFRVYLPRVAGDVKLPAGKLRSSTTGSETVLLVEDDDGVRSLVANLLRKNGYTVLVASQGDQAIEIASHLKGPIHLLLTDVVMPGMSGRQLAERLTGERPDTGVLYMSGYSDDAVLRQGVRSAGTHFIQKPFSIEAMAFAVREALSIPGQTH